MMNHIWKKAVLFAVGVVLVTTAAFGSTYSVESRTIPRFLDTNPTDSTDLYVPVYEYLSLGMTDLGVQGLSIHGSGWGRLGLGDVGGEDRTSGQLMYGYLEWRSPDNTVDLLMGRQLLFRGVATENMDGLLASVRLPGDFGVEAFGGKPVVSKDGTLKGDYLAGGRVYHRWVWKGEVGVSYIHSVEGDRIDRQNFGLDAFYRPFARWDLAGHVYYSIPFERLYEMTVLTTVKPIRGLKVAVDYNEKDPAARLGARSIFSVFAGSSRDAGIGAEYEVGTHASVAADGRYYWYEAGSNGTTGSRVGGEIRAFDIVRGKEEYALGLHRVTTPDQGYTEVRFYTLQNIIPGLTGAIEVIDTLYDEFIHGVQYSVDVDGSLIYSIRDNLTVDGTLFFSRNPRALEEYEGLIKLTYILKGAYGK